MARPATKDDEDRRPGMFFDRADPVATVLIAES